MSYSYRLSRFAAVGWIAVVCILGSARAGLASEETGKLDLQQNHIDMESAEKPNGANKQGYKNNEAYFESLTSIDTYNQDGAAYPHKQDAQNTQNQPTDDYSRRSAVAAELQAYVGVLGFLANLLTLYLIFKTYEATRKTANASVDSAKAAKDAVNIARSAFDDSKIAAAESAVKVAEALEAAQSTIRQFQLIADANAALVKQAERSADAAEKISVESAENANASLRLLNESIAHNQRAILSISAEANTLRIKDKSIRIDVDSITRNIGLSIATRCNIVPGIFESHFASIERLNKIMASPENYLLGEHIPGIPLFPGESINRRHELILDKIKITATDIAIEKNPDESDLYDGPSIVITCVYRLPGSEETKVTCYFFLVRNFNGTYFDLSKEDMSIDRTVRIKLYPAKAFSYAR